MNRGDLTRWNRAGLQRFRYVNGNAAVYLERLRASLYWRLKNAGLELDWPQLEPPLDGTEAFTEQERERGDQHLRAVIASRRNGHLVAQYINKRGDMAWELMRTFARACHILTEHVDAHVNEAFLRTATQWDHVRQMAETIDYRPSGPSSATTHLVLTASPGTRGVVKKGFTARYIPPGTGAPIIFETLEDIEISDELNELHLAGSGRSEAGLIEDDGRARFEVPRRVNTYSGSPALLTIADAPNAPYAVRVDRIEADSLSILVPDNAVDSKRWQARLAVAPGWTRRAWLNGPGVVRTEQPHGFSPNENVAWNDGDAWQFAIVQDADTRNLRFRAEDPKPPTGTRLYGATAIHAGVIPGGNETEAIRPNQATEPDLSNNDPPIQYRAAFSEDALRRYVQLLQSGISGSLPFITIPQLIQIAIAIMAKDLKIPSTGETPLEVMLKEIIGDLLSSGDSPMPIDPPLKELKKGKVRAPPLPDKTTFMQGLGGYKKDELLDGLPRFQFQFRYRRASDDVEFVRKDPQLKAVVASQIPRYVFDGRQPELEVDSWVLGYVGGEDNARPLRITAFGDNPNENYFWLEFDEQQQHDLSDKSLQHVRAGFRAMLRPVGASVNNEPATGLILEKRPNLLTTGRRILIVGADGRNPKEATVTSVSGNSIQIDQPLGGELTKGNLRIYGNVALAGHGETRPLRRLSSGFSSQDNATLTFEVDNVSSVQNTGLLNGPRPDVTLSIDGQIWQQVEQLDQSGPTDPHFTIAFTEVGHLRFGFGDGYHGRRLPPGNNNVHLRYRIGAGPAGNLTAGALTEMHQAHPLVAAVSQPLPALGGEAMEHAERMREYAPGKLLALDRAVSLSDFETLVALRRDVWHAHALRVAGGAGRFELIEVVVMPASGRSLPSQGGLRDELKAFLQARAVPTVRIRIADYVPQPVDLAVAVRVESAQYSTERVIAAVRRALAETFSLESRGIGRNLYHAEIYRAIEAVPGVIDSKIDEPVQGRDDQRIVPLSPAHAVFVDPIAKRGDGEPRLNVFLQELSP